MPLIPWWEYHRKMVERSKQAFPQEPRFKVGDWATLKSDNNPFKGSLKCGKAYPVRNVTFAYIGLSGTEDGNNGLFKEEYFDRLTYDPDPPGAREYDEIMQIQDYKDRESLSE